MCVNLCVPTTYWHAPSLFPYTQTPPPRLPLPKQDIIVVGDGFRGCKAWAGAKHTPVLQVTFGVRSWRGFVARPTAQVHFVAAFGVPLTYPTHIRQALVVCPAPPPTLPRHGVPHFVPCAVPSQVL